MTLLGQHFAIHEVTQQDWYHGGVLNGGRTLHDKKKMGRPGWLHVGTQKAAEDRLDPDNWDDEQLEYLRHARIHRVRVAPGAKVCPVIHRETQGLDAEDPGSLSFNPTSCGTGWDAHRYVNDGEDSGSTSMVVRPHMVRVEEDLGRHPKWHDEDGHTQRMRESGEEWTQQKRQRKQAAINEPYLHSSDVLYEPGDMIHPASKVSGIKSPYDGPNQHYSRDHAYMYRASEVPKDFRSQGGALYEVEPTGEVEPDPEPFRRKGPCPGSYRSRDPLVVKRVVHNHWQDPAERIPGGLRGADWQPSEQPRAQHFASSEIPPQYEVKDHQFYHGGGYVSLEHEGEHVGDFKWTPNAKDQQEVEDVWVHPDHRGQGLGRLMKQHAEGTFGVMIRHSQERTEKGDRWALQQGAVPVSDHVVWDDLKGREGARAFPHEVDEAKHVYLRFGDWPENEQSHNNATGHPEHGVSVYDLDHHGDPMDPDAHMERGHEHADHCEPDCDLDAFNDEYGNDTGDEMRSRRERSRRTRNTSRGDRAHLVKGTFVGVGHDGEPLLNSVEKVGHWPCDVPKHIPGATAPSAGNYQDWCDHPEHDEEDEHHTAAKQASLGDLAGRGYCTDEWSRWQHGQCGTYAEALIKAHPHMSLGLMGETERGHGDASSGWIIHHVFAHDQDYAYDSGGRHSLPYLGVHDDCDYAELNHDPEDFRHSEEEAGPDGPEKNLADAADHARRNGIVEGGYGPHVTKQASTVDDIMGLLGPGVLKRTHSPFEDLPQITSSAYSGEYEEQGQSSRPGLDLPGDGRGGLLASLRWVPASKSRRRDRRRDRDQQPEGPQQPDAPGVEAPEPKPLTWHNKAVKDIRSLHANDQKQILTRIEQLRIDDPQALSQTHALYGDLRGWSATKCSRGHRIIHQPTDDGGIYIGHVGLHEYGDANRRLKS